MVLIRFLLLSLLCSRIKIFLFGSILIWLLPYKSCGKRLSLHVPADVRWLSPESGLMGDTWCLLKTGLGVAVLPLLAAVPCFPETSPEVSTTERELGKLLFFVNSHFCFLRRYAARTSLLRRTCITKMKKP